MFDQEGFLRAVVERPDEDAPRLIYADWLEEQGDAARAALIRVQCELAPHGHRREPPALLEQENRLLLAHRRRFLAPLEDLGFLTATDRYGYGAGGGFTFGWRRGFVEALEVWGAAAARQFVDRADELYALTPLREVRFRPHSSYYGGFSAFDPMDLATFRALAALPHLRRLRLLDLEANGLRDDEGRALLAAPHLTRRTAVQLHGNEFSRPVQQELRRRFGDLALDGLEAYGLG
jgi:uncharacterized protein (TIGR02996 family)